MWKHWLTISVLVASNLAIFLLWSDQVVMSAIISLALFGLILFLGVSRVRLNYFVASINKGTKGVSLTFDDGPDPASTLQLLEILDKHQIKGAFFLIGRKIQEHEDLVKKIYEGGHLIGNHGFTHAKDLPMKGAAFLAEEFKKCDDEIQRVCGVTPRFVRIPFGLTTPNYNRALKKSKHLSIGWNFRSFDTMFSDEKKLEDRMRKYISRSSIILLHEANDITLRVLDKVLTEAKEIGIKFVPLDENIGQRAYN